MHICFSVFVKITKILSKIEFIIVILSDIDRETPYLFTILFSSSDSFCLIWILVKYSTKKKQIAIRIKEIIYANNTLDNLCTQENSKVS